MQALWNDVIIADSNDTVVLEGNHYFPLSSIKQEYFSESAHTSICPWKGLANYFNVEVDGKQNPNAAWIYKTPSAKASSIQNHVAFWKGIVVR
ncbi:MAG TPA: DUF427 domain-containing protein [Methylotenera sp.]|nr:DUF427 domain-containing protein [Methylotenera sp.]